MHHASQMSERAHVLGFLDFCRAKPAPKVADLIGYLKVRIGQTSQILQMARDRSRRILKNCRRPMKRLPVCSTCATQLSQIVPD